MLWDAFLAGGVIIAFVIMGQAHEGVFRTGTEGDKFTYCFFLVFYMVLASTCVAMIFLMVTKGFSGFKRTIRSTEVFAIRELFLSSITYCCSNLLTNYALTKVSYPTQVLVKSIKMVPITVGGFIFFGKRYPWWDYMAVVLISTSLIGLNLLAEKTSKNTQSSTLGVMLLFMSLACDMLTGPRQDRLIERCPTLGVVEMMFFTNFFSMFIAGTASVLFEGLAPYQYCKRYPEVVWSILGYASSASIGQMFIFSCLKAFGSLYLALITTLRKFLTILFSVIRYGHTLTVGQWICVAMIFGTLSVQSYCSKKAKERKKREQQVAI
eukprot:Lankesteria_metandrocarpae@DN1660_c0_g1_i1.p1